MGFFFVVGGNVFLTLALFDLASLLSPVALSSKKVYDGIVVPYTIPFFFYSQSVSLFLREIFYFEVVCKTPSTTHARL